jgi:hypothetical protein
MSASFSHSPDLLRRHCPRSRFTSDRGVRPYERAFALSDRANSPPLKEIYWTSTVKLGPAPVAIEVPAQTWTESGVVVTE